MLNLKELHEKEVTIQPFPFLIVPQFNEDYPKIKSPGSFPLEELVYGPRFHALIDQLRGEAFRQAIAEKFQVSLDHLPTIITVRGRCQRKDGKIHTDSKTKIVTVLLYMNPSWEASGGRLRLLHSAGDIDHFITEVPPVEGTLLAFKVTDNAWHGHLPFVGERRVIQLNWVANEDIAKREIKRHRFSAKLKKIKNLLKGEAH
jgi:SM-20-related protein